ncbi:MAG TPA: response regulator [Burkholderiales bacterium]|jgi:two-component system OmpR family response regulator|nr:response regulator [Burkholderiales bacterium]
MNDTLSKVLIVDDDEEIRDLLSRYLKQHSYDVNAVANGDEMRRALESGEPDIIILDLMLPGDSGLTLCRDLRARSDTPIIMLTARGDEMDRIVGLEMGADDYLPKPFNPRELLARMKVILRRARSMPKGHVPEQARFISFASWRLDTVERQLISLEGVVVALSASEYRLLRVFLDYPNRVLSRDQLMDQMHGRQGEAFDRSIDVQISRLRQRLGDDAREPVLIKTVRQEGYIFSINAMVEK